MTQTPDNKWIAVEDAFKEWLSIQMELPTSKLKLASLMKEEKEYWRGYMHAIQDVHRNFNRLSIPKPTNQ